MGAVSFLAIAGCTSQLQVGGIVRPTADKWGFVVDMIAFAQLYLAISTAAFLALEQFLDVFAGESAGCILFAGAIAFNCCPTLFGIGAVPFRRLCNSFVSNGKIILALLWGHAELASSIIWRSVGLLWWALRPKFRQRQELLALRTFLESRSKQPVTLNALRISLGTATRLAMTGVSISMSCVSVKRSKRKNEVAPRTKFLYHSVTSAMTTLLFSGREARAESGGSGATLSLPVNYTTNVLHRQGTGGACENQ